MIQYTGNDDEPVKTTNTNPLFVAYIRTRWNKIKSNKSKTHAHTRTPYTVVSKTWNNLRCICVFGRIVWTFHLLASRYGAVRFVSNSLSCVFLSSHLAVWVWTDECYWNAKSNVQSPNIDEPIDSLWDSILFHTCACLYNEIRMICPGNYISWFLFFISEFQSRSVDEDIKI